MIVIAVKAESYRIRFVNNCILPTQKVKTRFDLHNAINGLCYGGQIENVDEK